MAWTQSDSDVVHRRLTYIAVAFVDTDEEIERIVALATSEDLQTNLHDASDSQTTKAEALALKGVLDDFADFMDGNAVSADANRRSKLDAFLVRARAGTTAVSGIP